MAWHTRAVLGGILSTCSLVAGAALSIPAVAPAAEPSVDRDSFRLDPIPEQLSRVRGVHPRLFLDAAAVAALRTRAATAAYAGIWHQIKASADSAARKKPHAFTYTEDEQLWQRDVGNAMPQLAMAWLITGEKIYLAAARDYALASCSYATWGPHRIDGLDLPAGHQLLGLALVYDWCFSALDEPTRQTIRTTLIRRGEAMFQAAATGKIWWYRSYLQNHLAVSVTGLGTAGLAIFDEHEAALRWVALATDKIKHMTQAFGPDGASHEGVGYWSYGAEFTLKYLELARTLLGVDLYQGIPWWQNTASYRLYLSLPRAAWTPSNTVVDFGDSPRSDYYGPDHILRRLASEFHDGRAQWLAQELDDAKATRNSASWLNLIWQDSSVAPLAPGDAPALPTFHHFTDLGIVSSRSDWSGHESLVAFKCGPSTGHEAEQKFDYDPGAGHVHPDANHFIVFGGGEWLIRDDGYLARKETANHNTLTVDGHGQDGEGQEWFDAKSVLKDKASATILWARSSPALDQFAGDATRAYPPRLGVRQFIRRLAFIKPNVLIVVDDIELAGSHEMELQFHPEQPPAAVAGSATRFVATSAKTKLRLELLTPNGVKVSIETAADKLDHDQKPVPLQTLTLKRTGHQWQNVVALSWSDQTTNPPMVRLRREGAQLIFAVNDQDALTWPADARDSK